MDIDSLADWVLRKIGLPDNRIRNIYHLQDKLKQSQLLVVFMSAKFHADREFAIYLSAARHLLKLSEVEFAYLYFEDFSKSFSDYESII
jgi:hypothetical protein